jgi:O-antigen ligase
MMGEQYINRMSTIRDLGGSDVSARSRWDGLINGVEMMIKRPILGVGPGCYPLVRRAWFGWGLWSHNIYGQLAGELGIIGCIVWFRFMRQYIEKCWQLRKILSAELWLKNMATAIFVSSIVALSLGMFSHSLYSFIWIIMAVVTINLTEFAQNITNPSS